MNPLPICFTVREVAEKRGFKSQRQLAAHSHIDVTTMSLLYRDRPSMISKVTMSKLCKALKCSPGDLLQVSRPPTLTLEGNT